MVQVNCKTRLSNKKSESHTFLSNYSKMWIKIHDNNNNSTKPNTKKKLIMKNVVAFIHVTLPLNERVLFFFWISHFLIFCQLYWIASLFRLRCCSSLHNNHSNSKYMYTQTHNSSHNNERNNAKKYLYKTFHIRYSTTIYNIYINNFIFVRWWGAVIIQPQQ